MAHTTTSAKLQPKAKNGYVKHNKWIDSHACLHTHTQLFLAFFAQKEQLSRIKFAQVELVILAKLSFHTK